MAKKGSELKRKLFTTKYVILGREFELDKEKF